MYYISSLFQFSFFQGSPDMLVPYMAEAGHICPTTHNPADFVLETFLGNLESTAQLSELCLNGKLCKRPNRIMTRGGRFVFSL